MQEQLLTSKSEHWCTPLEIIDAIKAHFGPIGLDPCTNPYSQVRARLELDFSKDGLTASWQNKGLVYVNPPYGRKLPRWVKKIAVEATAGAEIISLLPARTDTKWFHETILPFATAIVLIKGRIKFVDGLTGECKNSATFPSMLVYYGENVTKFTDAFGDRGFVISL